MARSVFPRGAVVVMREISGANAHIRRVADGFALESVQALRQHSPV